jgi:hypothetical protein
MDIRQMYFNEAELDRRKRIPQRHTGMSQAPGINDDPRNSLLFRVVHPLDQRTLVIALEDTEGRSVPAGQVVQPIVDALQSFGPIDTRFAGTQQIQVWTVKDENSPALPRGRATSALGLGHGGKFAADASKLSSSWVIFPLN